MNHNVDHIDNELFARLAKGDEEAFRQIVHFFYKRTLPLTISLVKSDAAARDILQDVFLKLWLKRDTLAFIDNPAAWMKVVIANATSNHIRAQLRYELKMKNATNDQTDKEEIWEDIDARFTRTFIDEAVVQLPSKRKQIFLLSQREGLSRKEIASLLNISENTVRNQLSEAVQFIQEHLRRRGAVIIPSLIVLQSLIK